MVILPILMSPERIMEIQALLLDLERRMRPLRWDLDHNQINEFKRQKLEKLQGEHLNLKTELQGIQ